MKNWIARLFGASPGTEPAAAAPVPSAAGSTTPPAEPPAAPPKEAAAGIPASRAGVDAAFLRWLAGSAAEAPAGTERLILDELARLADEPARAAGLVPRVPAVIPELLRSLRDDSISGADLSRLVAQDVVLVAEVVREANSPYYRPPTPVRTIEGAVLLLGRNGLRMLLARVAFRPVIGMQSGRLAKLAAPRIWQQSEKCALACATLAPHAGVDPFEAYLAGLVQNVGLIAAFRLIDQVADADLLPRSDAFCAALGFQARRLAHGIALEWAFPPAVAAAIAAAGECHLDADGGALAGVLGTADVLAKLRLLADAGAMSLDDPLAAAHLTPRLRPCFDLLQSRET
jgi:HD-like signal output (HDOD) protein